MKMNKKRALAFLRAHQPMPDTDKYDCDDLIDEWERVCEYFIENPDIEAVPLLLGSFGDTDGCEVYQSFHNVVEQLDPNEVAPFLIEALSPSSSEPIRILAADACIDVLSNNPTYHETLLSLIEDFDENESVRSYCALAFSAIGQEGLFDVEVYRKRVESVLKKETDKGVIESLTELLGDEDIEEDNIEEEAEVTKVSALAFLRSHQPMPEATDCQRPNLFRQWFRVCYYFMRNPDIEAFPLLLGSLGNTDVDGVYDYFKYAAFALDPEQVAPYLVKALSTPSLPIRIRVAEACDKVYSKNLAYQEALLSRIEDSDEDEEVRYLCANSFVKIGQKGLFDIEKYRTRIDSIIKKEKRPMIIYCFNELLSAKG